MEYPNLQDTLAPSPTVPLMNTKLFQATSAEIGWHGLITRAYARAQAIGKAYKLQAQDVLNMTPKFWELHQDLIFPTDMAAFTLITIQYNLAAGTLAPFVAERAELQELLQEILDFKVSAQFLLSEVGHGLDSPNLETVATKLPTGDFDLHTPIPAAAKFMPPTTPKEGLPCIGIVFAKLLINGEDQGVRPFVVPINDGANMCEGITARVLPRRGGSIPVDHSITYFDHVWLPATSLLGSPSKPANMRDNFISVISRVRVGTLCLSTTCIAALKLVGFIAGSYSLRRMVTGKGSVPVPIISFRTQQRPILHVLAQTVVFEAYARDMTKRYLDVSLDPRVRDGLAAALKVVLVQAAQSGVYELTERCGAQGLFKHNQMIQLQLDLRGVSIAEGDSLVLCIRLASELLVGRYKMPSPNFASSLLAIHEEGLFREARGIMKGLKGSHRGEDFNRQILPLCQPLIEAVGHRFAYEAALEAGVDSKLLALYEIWAIKRDASWYSEYAGLSRQAQMQMEDVALNEMPELSKLLQDTRAEPYCSAPIVSDVAWNSFCTELPKHGSGTKMAKASL